jgi:hypothetical protein
VRLYYAKKMLILHCVALSSYSECKGSSMKHVVTTRKLAKESNRPEDLVKSFLLSYFIKRKYFTLTLNGR